MEANNEMVEVENDDVNPGGQESIIINDHKALRMTPDEGRVPLSILQDKDSNFLSFPTIFCGKRLAAMGKFSYSNIIKSITRRYNRRGVERVDYLLYMDRKYQLMTTINAINTIIRKRKKTFCRNQ